MPIKAKTLTIKDIELRNQARRKLLTARQYYVQFSVGNKARSTNVAKEERNHTSFLHEHLSFDVDDHSDFVVKVYQKHHIGKDTIIATLIDTIGGVSDKLNAGVFEGDFGKDTTDTADHSGITIKFALAVESDKGVSADELQAIDANIKATEGVSASGPTPREVGLLSSVVDKGTTIVSNAQSFDATWGGLLDRLKLFDKIVTDIAQIHPYTSMAWSVISAISQALVDQRDRDDRITSLASTMSDVFDFVHEADPLKLIKAHIKGITLLIQQVTECGYFIAEYTKQRNFWIRTAKYAISDIDDKITGYETKLRELKTAFLEGVILQTELTVVRMMNDVEHTAKAIDLNDMPYAFGARYAEEKGCMPGTRESVLEDICGVLNNIAEDAPQVCLLTGVAGSGKSSIAHSIAQRFDALERLGSSYCFASSDVARRNPQNLFSTVAQDLADHDPQYKTALWRIVKNNRALRTSTSPSEQVKRLIVEPSTRIHAIGPLVIVIDALDESGNPDERKQLLDTLSRHIAERKLPTNLRFLISTRPENDILEAFPSDRGVVRKHLGDVPEADIDKDIDTFIRDSLQQYTELDTSWPNGEWCRLLVEHSQRLFQWASTACKFIGGRNANGLDQSERLQLLLDSNNREGIDASLDKLYRTILEQEFSLHVAQSRFQDVMAIVLALKEPLPLASLHALFDGRLKVREIIRPLGSLLDGVHDEDKPIRPLHTSFRDFLLDEARSSSFHIKILPQHSLCLGEALLQCMRDMLKFNLCDLKDSRVCNQAVPDLTDQVLKTIPPHLSYSCHYWMDHLQHAISTPELVHDITLFFKNFFPYWLEAISLLSFSSPLSSILSAIHTCGIIVTWAKGQEVAILASEASQFIQVFASLLRQSTPHLYLSAMPQTPTSSPLCKLWVDHLQKHVMLTSGGLASWSAEILTLRGHTDEVWCISYSPDGSQIVSGARDNTIRVWNATTGQLVAGPFQGHTEEINSVAYSPDGRHIASGARDKTIRVWNATTGQLMASPFQGHTEQVNSVAYSPDGNHIASSSWDKTIRIWNAITGQCVAGPFQEQDAIHSVVYSPDGTHIVSGSEDKTIRVWDATTGQVVAGPFGGHGNSVFCVAYSPDGRHIVSGSWDHTVRVWDESTGQLVAGPFQGHTNTISCVAYSPNGDHIVSSSWDDTIRIWNAATGQCIAGPFEGHEDRIEGVAYSPDGNHIASGSTDMTIRVWDATGGESPFQKGYPFTCIAHSPVSNHIISGSGDKTISIWDTTSGQLVAGPFEGHTKGVSCIAYSSDGMHIASGSWDGTIRVWDSTTAQCVVGPLQEHTNRVTSIAYSPLGDCIVSGSQDKTIRIWNATTGECVAGPFQGHTHRITSVAYSPDGTHIASCSQDRTIRVWSATTGQCVVGPLQGHKSRVNVVAYSPNGQHIVSGSMDETIRMWDATTGQCIAGPLEGHTSFVTSLAYSPDGTHFVSGSGDACIRLWNATTGECVAGPFEGHAYTVNSVTYSSDGIHIITASTDSFIKVWRVQDVFTYHDLYLENGWIQSSGSFYFTWVTSWNRDAFHLPTHFLVISSDKTDHIDIDSSLFGESWISCWK